MNRDTCGTCFAPSDLCKCTETHKELMEQSAEYRDSFYRFNKPALREAAQAVCDRWDTPSWTHDAPHTGALIAALREAMRDEASNEMEALTPSEYQELAALTKTHQQLDEALAERHTFNHWWNEGEVSPGDNPYTHETAAYWAWEGWQAAIRARGQE